MKSNPFATRFTEPGTIAWQSSDVSESLETIWQRLNDSLHFRAAIVGPHGSGKSTLVAHLVDRLAVPCLRCGTSEILDETHWNHLRSQLIQALAPHSPIGPVELGDAEHTDSNAKPPETSRTTPALSTHQGWSAPISATWLTLRGQQLSRRLLKRAFSTITWPAHLWVLDGYEQLSWLQRWLIVVRSHYRNQGLLITSHRPTILGTLATCQVSPQLAERLTQQLLTQQDQARTMDVSGDELAELLRKHSGNMREVFMELYDRSERVSQSEQSSSLPR